MLFGVCLWFTHLDKLAPLILGPVGDKSGRRPMLLLCLLTLSASCIGLALIPTSAYWALMLLRCEIQGISERYHHCSPCTYFQMLSSCWFCQHNCTWSVWYCYNWIVAHIGVRSEGAGIIGDISIPAERGGFMAIFSIGPMVGPSIGPIVGGALAQHFGWR
jgi:MFS family permease